ncbi:MAG: hypothetical protein VYC80_17695 [Planctomycetota bacterium]|nr:hypothetical protein [Planctomycetota bacterium]
MTDAKSLSPNAALNQNVAQSQNVVQSLAVQLSLAAAARLVARSASSDFSTESSLAPRVAVTTDAKSLSLTAVQSLIAVAMQVELRHLKLRLQCLPHLLSILPLSLHLNEALLFAKPLGYR